MGGTLPVYGARTTPTNPSRCWEKVGLPMELQHRPGFATFSTDPEVAFFFGEPRFRGFFKNFFGFAKTKKRCFRVVGVILKRDVGYASVVSNRKKKKKSKKFPTLLI